MISSVAAFDSFPIATIFLMTAPRRQQTFIIFQALFEFEEGLSFFLYASDF
jgi:hypothetical protein